MKVSSPILSVLSISCLCVLIGFAAAVEGAPPSTVEEGAVPSGEEVSPPPEARGIIIGSADESPPFSWRSFTKEPTGFSVDLTWAVAKAAGFEYQLEMGDWNTIKRKLRNGQIDAVDSMYYSIERDLYFDFSEPHHIASHAIFVWEEDKNIRSLKDLRGRSVLAVRGDVMHQFLLEERIGVNLILTRSLRDAMELLSLHRGEAAVLARMPALYYVKELTITNVKEISARPIEPLEICFAVKEGNQELLAKLNRGLAAVKASGEYARIRRKWFDPLEPRRDIRDYIPHLVIGCSIFLLAIGLLWFWNWLLQREVRMKTEELRIANEKLQKIDQFKTDLVQMVSHEVRTPLGVLQGYLDHLREGNLSGLDPSQMRALDKIQNSIDRINRLVGDLMDMALIDSEKLQIHLSTVDAEKVTADVAQFFENLLRDRHIALARALKPESIFLQADRDRLEQCLINLMSNAIKHTPQGGKIELVVRELNEEVVFEVHDTGEGMDRRNMGRLFQKFESEDRRHGTGYGLGLTITKGLVELHGGRIWAESQEGKGSVFYFAIPKL